MPTGVLSSLRLPVILESPRVQPYIIARADITYTRKMPILAQSLRDTFSQTNQAREHLQWKRGRRSWVRWTSPLRVGLRRIVFFSLKTEKTPFIYIYVGGGCNSVHQERHPFIEWSGDLTSKKTEEKEKEISSHD